MAKKKWYAGVVCWRCGAHVPWVEDPSRGKVELVSDSGAKISLTCKVCRLAATYPFEVVTRFAEGTSPRVN